MGTLGISTSITPPTHLLAADLVSYMDHRCLNAKREKQLHQGSGIHAVHADGCDRVGRQHVHNKKSIDETAATGSVVSTSANKID